jgi:hypothetical protein
MKTRISKLFLPLLTLCTAIGGTVQGHAQPTTIAPTPAVPPGQVIALYNSSGTYTDISGVNFFEIWWGGQWTSYGPYPIPGTSSVVNGYQGLYFTGVGFEGNPQDVSGCTNLHVDVFTPNGNSFAVRVVDTTGHQADITFTTASGVITNNGWISLDLPLSQFVAATPLLDLHYIQQLGWIINNPGETSPADYYVDNVYFSSGTNLIASAPPVIPTPTNNAPLPARPAASVQPLYTSSGVYPDNGITESGINWDASWSGSAESSFAIPNTGGQVLYMLGLSYVGVEFYDPDSADATNYTTLHFDVWNLDANQIGVELVSLAPTIGPVIYTALNVTSQWVGIDIPLSQFTAANGALDLGNLQQMLWLDNGGPGIQGGTFYIDNVYFWTTNQVQVSGSLGAQVGWTAAHGADTYQPQKSADNTTWSNLGPALSGNTTTSTFDATPGAYYRVLDIASAAGNALLDPSFEIPAANNCGAANWTSPANIPFQSVWVTNSCDSLTPTDGTNLLYMEGSTPATGPVTPPNAYVQSDRAPVTGGDTYIVQFSAANPVKIGGANPQYRVSFYNATGGDVGDNWNSFASAGNAWMTVSNNFAAPPTATQMDILFIQAVGAGSGWDWVTLLDNLSAVDAAASSVSTTNILSATVTPGVGLSWQSGPGLTYSVQSTTNLTVPLWSPVGANVTAASTNSTTGATATGSQQYFRVLEIY